MRLREGKFAVTNKVQFLFRVGKSRRLYVVPYSRMSGSRGGRESKRTEVYIEKAHRDTNV